MKEIRIIDTTLRDAHQCLWATRMTTAMMLPVAEQMDCIGFESIDLAGTIQFDVCVRYLKEDPWERVRLMRQRVENTPLRALIRSKNLLSFDVLPDDINELWVQRLVANGFRVIGAFDGLNDLDNMVDNLQTAKELGAYTFGALSFSESPVHTDELYVNKAKELIKRTNVDAVMIKDAGGVLTPERIRTLVPALKEVIGEIPLELHSHCLTSLAPLVYVEGVKAGADQLHTSIAPLANGPAQPSTQATIRNLNVAGYKVDLDNGLIDEVSEHFRVVAEQEGKPVGVPLEYDAFHYEHQVPGGMLTNLQFQLEQAGIPHRLDEVLHECAQVRKELGWPIMITPFAQHVGTQAVLNVINGMRYKIVPDEVKKYVLGYYGELPADVDPEIYDRIVENGSKQIPLEPEPLEPAVPELRKKYPEASDDERLLRYMFAGSQVDEMLSSSAIEADYSIEKTPLVRLIDELTKRPKLGHVFIQKDSLRLELGAEEEKETIGEPT